MNEEQKTEKIEQILETPGLAGALENDHFKQFLDQVPVAIAVAELQPTERIVYVNMEFERLSGRPATEAVGKSWDLLNDATPAAKDGMALGAAVLAEQEHVGTFTIGSTGLPVNAWSSVIKDDQASPVFRLVALVAVDTKDGIDGAAIAQQLHDKDTLLRELQHRVKNNLQMITALIRLEARKLPEQGDRFDRLAGRIEALALLYQSLSEDDNAEVVDLGTYLSQVASAVMRAHAVEGIRLDLKVDTWPVSINIAMPTGLVVNELLTNALKHGFKDRDGGTITVRSLVDDEGCSVTVADDGIGLADGMTWPQRGKLSALIVESLRQNADAEIDVQSTPDHGVRVTIRLSRAATDARALPKSS